MVELYSRVSAAFKCEYMHLCNWAREKQLLFSFSHLGAALGRHFG